MECMCNYLSALRLLLHHTLGCPVVSSCHLQRGQGKVQSQQTLQFLFRPVMGSCFYRGLPGDGGETLLRGVCLSFSQKAFLAGEHRGLRGSLGLPYVCMCGEILHSSCFFKKKHLPGQCHFLWHRADSRNSLYLREMDADIFYSKGLTCTETFHAERTKPLDSLERNTGPHCASLFLATHWICLLRIRYQAQYHAEKGIHLRSECWCLTGLVM